MNYNTPQFFILRLLVFLLLPATLIVLMEVYIMNYKVDILDESNLEKHFLDLKSEYYWIGRVDADSIIVLSGSSSVRYGLSCKLLNDLNSDRYKYVNVANDARDPVETYFILKNLDLRRVRYVYFAIDPWIFTRRYYKNRNKILYADFTFLQILQYQLEHDKSAIFSRYSSFLRSLVNISRETQEKNYIIPDDFGSQVLDKKAKNFDVGGDWFQLRKYGWSDLQFEYLKKIVELCRFNNIIFSLFFPPKQSNYSIFLRLNSMNEHMKFNEKLVKIGIKSRVFGKFNILDKIGDSIFFADPYHLNEQGQVVFTKLFFHLTNSPTEFFSKDYSLFTN